MKKFIIMPAYNVEKTLENTIKNIPFKDDFNIIVVDDGSQDNTYNIAVKLKVDVYKSDKNKGYGATQKICYKIALEKGADIIIMLHPDYQYEPRVIPAMVNIIENDICDVVLGNRIRTRKESLNGGMPLYKYISNRFLTIIENIISGQNLGKWHSGLRAYSSKVLKTIRWEDNSDDFSFDSEFLFQCVNAGLRIGDISVSVKYFKEASSIDFLGSVVYGIKTLLVCLEYIIHKSRIFRFSLFDLK